MGNFVEFRQFFIGLDFGAELDGVDGLGYSNRMSEWVSSFLTAHQYIIRLYLVPYDGEDIINAI